MLAIIEKQNRIEEMEHAWLRVWHRASSTAGAGGCVPAFLRTLTGAKYNFTMRQRPRLYLSGTGIRPQ